MFCGLNLILLASRACVPVGKTQLVANKGPSRPIEPAMYDYRYRACSPIY